MKTIVALCLPLLLAACATTGATTGIFPAGPAAIGQTVYVDGPIVRPLAVIEDSRCPVDVVCVWAGRVVVRAEVGTGRGKKVMALELGQPVQIADGMLTLREVTPDARQGQAIKPGDYLFYFEFAGGI